MSKPQLSCVGPPSFCGRARAPVRIEEVYQHFVAGALRLWIRFRNLVSQELCDCALRSPSLANRIQVHLLGKERDQLFQRSVNDLRPQPRQKGDGRDTERHARKGIRIDDIGDTPAEHCTEQRLIAPSPKLISVEAVARSLITDALEDVDTSTESTPNERREELDVMECEITEPSIILERPLIDPFVEPQRSDAHDRDDERREHEPLGFPDQISPVEEVATVDVVT